MFRGQTTDHVAQILDSLNIKVVKVPANMTHFFQPLDLTVNGSAKHFMRKRFVTWYAEKIKKQMDAGVLAESIDVNLKLTSLKALHANWLIELNNVLTTGDGRETVLRLQLQGAIYRPNSFVLMLRYCANLKAIRYESTSLNRIIADKSHRVIVA